MGTLYAVAVPLGNLGDITFRAVEILKSVDCIACEDTRNTRILLDKYNIVTNVIDCHKFNEKENTVTIDGKTKKLSGANKAVSKQLKYTSDKYGSIRESYFPY